MKRNTKQLIPMILVFTIIAAAYSCRMLAMLDIGGVWMNYIRAALYLLLFSMWGYSIDRRIIQKQALHCLRLTAALMLRNRLGDADTPYGGYESLRVRRIRPGDDTLYTPHATRYTYAWPCSFYLTISYRF